MTTPVKTENLRAAFSKVMQSHQLKPQEVKKKYSNIAFSGLGAFTCIGTPRIHCAYAWRSNFSWVTFDLINLEVVYRWKMKCKYCGSICTPTFTEEQLESMFNTVVIFYKGENSSRDVDIGYRAGARRNYHQPHLPILCEKCGWGQILCWSRKFHYM